MPDIVILLFVFAFGACVGSFLNVVVWRLPRGESLVTPPSRCPKCGHKLAAYDNVPVLGWLWLRGKCRYCKSPISPRYPIVEAVCGGLFVLYYVCYFDLQMGPCVTAPRALNIRDDWPIFALHLFMIASLLAASLIDADLFIIPPEIPWLMAAVGVVSHAIIAAPGLPGTLIVGGGAGALAMGALVGWLISLLLLRTRRLGISFPQGEPMLDVDRDAAQQEIDEARRRGEDPAPLPPVYSRGQLYAELGKELLFLLPPMLLAGTFCLLTTLVPGVGGPWSRAMSHPWFAAAMGSVLGAMVGAMLVWVTRILGTLAFGRLAMGLGDVHLMFGVGAVIGAGAVTVAFFLAPFGGMAIAVYLMLFGRRREIPYGPYLSLGTAATLIFYCPIANWLAPGLTGLGEAIRTLITGGA